MPNFSKGEVILVRYPFSDLSSAKVRPAVVVSAVLLALQQVGQTAMDLEVNVVRE